MISKSTIWLIFEWEIAIIIMLVPQNSILEDGRQEIILNKLCDLE